MNETVSSLPARAVRPALFAAIAGVIALSIVAFAVAAYFAVLRPMQRDVARATMGLSADRVEAVFEAWTRTAEQGLRVTLVWSAQNGLDPTRHADIARIAVAHLQARPLLLQVLFANEDGRAIFVGKQGTNYLARVIDARGGNRIQKWLTLDPIGRTLEEKTEARDYDPRTRPWYMGAVSAGAGKLYWSDPYIFFESRQPGLTVSSTLRDIKSGQRWVIAFDYLLHDLSQATGQNPVGKTGGIALLSREGRVLGLPHEPGRKPGDYDLTRLMKLPGEAGLAALAQGWADWLAGGTGADVFGYRWNDEPWFGRFRVIRLQNLSLIIAAVAPAREFTIGADWNAVSLVLLALVVFAFAYAFASAILRRAADNG